MEEAYLRGDPNWKYVNRWELPKNRPLAEREAWRRTHHPSYMKAAGVPAVASHVGTHARRRGSTFPIRLTARDSAEGQMKT